MKNIIEINKGHYARFEDMVGLVNSMRKTAKVWSWGARGWTNVEGKLLKFRVSGNLFKGVVYVGVNGLDLFDIFFTNLKGDIKDQLNNIHVDELVDNIDQKVERIPNYKW